MPIYDYTIYDRTDQCELVVPGKVVVVEGILVLWEPRLRGMLDLKVFVDTPADLRVIRRLRRDVAERGRTQESILEQYLTTVRPSHEQFIEPSKRYADVIVPEGGLNRPALEVLLARVRELTNARREELSRSGGGRSGRRFGEARAGGRLRRRGRGG